MLFHTWTFVVFFAIFYPIYLLVRNTRARVPWLLLASYVFYGWWNPLYLLLILWSTTVDYLAVIGMAKTRWRRLWLCWSLLNNLGMLGFFKYGGFVAQNINTLLIWAGIPYAIPEPDVLLPVGISFFVFQSMSYTIDYYRGNVDRETSFLSYAAFVSLFPQLVAGPIERAKNLLPQLRQTPRIAAQDVADGLSLFVVGLFKKVALADYLALYVDPIYASPDSYQAPALLLATFAFGWQIYFDFSGYTDMARGIGRILGIRLMLNFNNPYLATGLGDFWRRWHISLSSWFRDYVYIPLGGNRRGTLRTYVNIWITMVVSGLWHGAMWTFVIWGAVHAAGYSLTRSLERSRLYQQRVPRIAKQLLTFAVVNLAWVFFRAESVQDAWLILQRIFTSGWADPRCPAFLLLVIAAVWIYEFIYESRLRPVLMLAPLRTGLVVLMLAYLAVAGGLGEKAFIYFQF
ncbi:MAG: MBOAT family protein [Planctomycetes bacterium]|nr:MBOAT family protein [Planctomycetota bacterium]